MVWLVWGVKQNFDLRRIGCLYQVLLWKSYKAFHEFKKMKLDTNKQRTIWDNVLPFDLDY